MVVDAGPDPRGVDECLDGSTSTTVPLVVLTHFHADHVDGLPGVLEDRAVGEVDVTSMVDPPERRGGRRAARSRHAPVVADHGVTRQVGDVTLQVLWPLPGAPTAGVGDGSEANDASVVLLARCVASGSC